MQFSAGISTTGRVIIAFLKLIIVGNSETLFMTVKDPGVAENKEYNKSYII